MPLVEKSEYAAPWWLRNGHVQTIANAFRRAPRVAYLRERIETPDGDFLDLDWCKSGAGGPVCPAQTRTSAPRLAVVSYGMESESSSAYVRATVALLCAENFDVVVWNYRGCGGEPNRKLHFYHGGLIADLDAVIRHAIARGYSDIRLAGFSLGGNLLLNWLGHRGADVPAAVKRAVAFSVPTDVADCAVQLHGPLNRIYARLFLRSFRKKVRAKMAAMPGQLDDRAFDSIATLEDYDGHYTVPQFGFASVADMYRSVSSRHVIGSIRVPTLIVCALDDPFMGPNCFPADAARENPNIFLECPRHGGHLGFLQSGGGSWMEKRVVDFLAARPAQSGQCP